MKDSGYYRSKPARQLIAVAIVAVGTIAAGVLLTLELSRKERGDKPQLPTPIVPMSPAEVRVRAVERKTEPVEQSTVAAASGAAVIVCGMDEATAGRYEARNNALRSIARRHGANEQRENMV